MCKSVSWWQPLPYVLILSPKYELSHIFLCILLPRLTQQISGRGDHIAFRSRLVAGWQKDSASDAYCLLISYTVSPLTIHVLTNFGNYWKTVNTIIINHELLGSKKLLCCSYHRDWTFYADRMVIYFSYCRDCTSYMDCI